MILLDYHNRILEELIQSKIDFEVSSESKREALDVTLADFDGVLIHVTSDGENKNILKISLQWRCAGDLKKNGADELLKSVYGNLLLAKAETSYDVTLQLDLDKLPGDKDKLAAKIGLLKRNILAGPYKRMFDAIDKGETPNPIYVQYRENEAFFLKPEGDRCIVIFSVYFKDADDQILAKVFLQEFADAKRTLNNVPHVTFSQKEPPLELKGVKGVTTDGNQGFVSFVLFKPHIDTKNRDKTINNIQTFRDYLHYHIKCAKGYLHTRMRNRVDSLLQVLNRAKAEPLEPREKKTISGKTFKGTAPGKAVTKGAKK